MVVTHSPLAAHIATFDGRAVEFPGTCTSGFAESCGSSGSLPFFEVEPGKENRTITKMSIQENGTQICPQKQSLDPAEVSTHWPPETLALIEAKRGALAQTNEKPHDISQ